MNFNVKVLRVANMRVGSDKVLKAVLDVEIADALIIHGVTIIKTPDGHKAMMPLHTNEFKFEQDRNDFQDACLEGYARKLMEDMTTFKEVA